MNLVLSSYVCHSGKGYASTNSFFPEELSVFSSFFVDFSNATIRGI
jgi:hypothetical protein